MNSPTICKNASLEKHGQKRNFMVIFEIFFSVCCCFDCIVICVTNSVNTSGFEIAETKFLNASRTPQPHLSLQPSTNRNGNEQGNATLILT